MTAHFAETKLHEIDSAESVRSPVPALKPPLKWAGGKRWLVAKLRPLWLPHQHRRLVEPFCGGMAVALALNPSSALLNDINPHLINFYRWLKRGLIAEVEMGNEKTLFYSQRARFNHLVSNGAMNSQETAELFYYLNRTCYNGLCRFNRKGEFNVPFGRYKRINYQKDFSAYSRVFADWDFSTVDFEKTALKSDDFVYADPPYDVEFTQYAREGFEWDDQVRLVKWLTQHPGPTVLSNQATTRIVKLYRQEGFDVTFLEGPRRISCTGDRSPAKEVLATRGI